MDDLTATEPPEAPLVGVGGWLAFFCFILIAVNPLLTVVRFITTNKLIEALRSLDPDSAKTFDSFNSFVAVFSFALAVFSIVVGILLVRRTGNAVTVAKIYAASVPTVALLALLAVFGSSSSADMREGMVQGSIHDLVKSLGFFAIWFTYLWRSRRVKNTCPKSA